MRTLAWILVPLWVAACGTTPAAPDATTPLDVAAETTSDGAPDSSADPLADGLPDPSLDPSPDPVAEATSESGPDADAAAPAIPGIGVHQATLVDSTRTTPENGMTPQKPDRTLPTRIWYPSSSDPSAGEVEDAPPGLAGGPYPLVLVVHGSTGTAVAYSWIAAALVPAGYVVAAADFPLTSLLTDGGPSDWHVEDQPDDLSFLADRFAAGGVDGVPGGMIDAAKGYSIVGHSTGGTVALLAAYRPDKHDARVAAIVDLSGDSCFFGDAFFATRAVPALMVGASRDLYVPAPNNVVRAYDLASPPKTHVILKGGSHIHFTDLDAADIVGVTPTTPADPLAQTLATWGGGTTCEPFPAPADDVPMTMADQHAIAGAWARAFLDATVRGEATRLEALRTAGDPRVDAAWVDQL